ncbi:MAG: tRNA pseudouridine(38-40) synthase TruA, partial [Desulfobacteraceae bacterium]
NIKLVLEYDGANYCGWQRLADKKHTLQGRLEYILEQFLKEKVELIGASRTDKDVHALGQVANFKTRSSLSLEEIEAELTARLPKDIRAISVEQVPERFHARYMAKMKEYVYQVWNSEKKNVFERSYFYHIAEPLDIAAMKKAKEYFVGVKDFKNFTAMKGKDKSTIKTIERIDIAKAGEKVLITFKGEGFLHKMVRIITGTLLEVGLGERSLEDVAAMFEKPSRLTSGFTAPAHGLFLKKVYY